MVYIIGSSGSYRGQYPKGTNSSVEDWDEMSLWCAKSTHPQLWILSQELLVPSSTNSREIDTLPVCALSLLSRLVSRIPSCPTPVPFISISPRQRCLLLLRFAFQHSRLKYWWIPREPSLPCQQLLSTFLQRGRRARLLVDRCWNWWVRVAWCRHVLSVAPAVSHSLVSLKRKKQKTQNSDGDLTPCRGWPFIPATWSYGSLSSDNIDRRTVSYRSVKEPLGSVRTPHAVSWLPLTMLMFVFHPLLSHVQHVSSHLI